MAKAMHHREDGSKVFIAVPTYGDMCAEFVFSLWKTKDKIGKCDFEILAGNCHVDDSRNRLVRDFLETKCDTFVFLDADIRFDSDDLVRLIEYDRDIVAGIYPYKADNEDYPVKLPAGDLQLTEDGLLQADMVPTGFLKIKRHVLEDLYEKCPKHRVKSDKPRNLSTAVIFERRMEGHIRLGGDYEFCRKATESGYSIFIDPRMRFGHIGSTEWSGSLGDYLRRVNGLTDNFIHAVLEKIKNGEETMRDLDELFYAWGSDWGLPADELSILIHLCRSLKNKKVIECGSGISTAVMAACGCDVVSLEHNVQWANKINELLNATGLDAEIVQCSIKNDFYHARKAIGRDFGMILIDGPPRLEGSRDRAVDCLIESLADDCVWFIDDADDNIVTEKLNELSVDVQNFGRLAVAKGKGGVNASNTDH